MSKASHFPLMAPIFSLFLKHIFLLPGQASKPPGALKYSVFCLGGSSVTIEFTENSLYLPCNEGNSRRRVHPELRPPPLSLALPALGLFERWGSGSRLFLSSPPPPSQPFRGRRTSPPTEWRYIEHLSRYRSVLLGAEALGNSNHKYPRLRGAGHWPSTAWGGEMRVLRNGRVQAEVGHSLLQPRFLWRLMLRS